MTIPSDEDLLRLIEDFLGRTGMAPTRFGLDATGEGGLVKSLRDGRSITLRHGRRLVDFMEAYELGQAESPNAPPENCPSEDEAA